MKKIERINALTPIQMIGTVAIIALLVGGISGAIFGSIVANRQQSDELTSNEYTLEAYISGYVGVGGSIDGIVNPELLVNPFSNVTITLIAGEITHHDFTIDGVVTSERVSTDEEFGVEETTFSFLVEEDALLEYYCSISGHYTTMHGDFVVGQPSRATPEPAMNLEQSVIKNPTDIPDPVGVRSAQNITITLVTEEITAKLDDGTSFTFWTFNGTVPGPMIRVRVGDNVTLRLTNPADSTHTHSVDFHAVNANGGGAAFTQAAPGETAEFWFIPEWEGAFVYHCASPHIPTHISKGMYGAISVEPATGLPAVDREFYVGQNEIYTKFDKGIQGHQVFDDRSQLEENPNYVLFNGQVNALAQPGHTLNATVNETIRIFFAVGGPNLISSFHLIGGVWDRVYYETNWDDPNMLNAETIAVVPGSVVAVEVDLTRTGTFILVDHALTRVFDKGALGLMYVNE